MSFETEVDVPRRAPTLKVSPSMFGASLVDTAVNTLVRHNYNSRWTPELAPQCNLSGMSFGLFAPSGTGKTAVAAEVLRLLRIECPWLTTLHAPWIAAEWLALNLQPGVTCKVTGDSLIRHLSECRLLCIDGLGEEHAKLRDRVVNLVKNRLDYNRPFIITSRLSLDGPDSLSQLYPGLRAVLNDRFVHAEPKR